MRYYGVDIYDKKVKIGHGQVLLSEKEVKKEVLIFFIIFI